MSTNDKNKSRFLQRIVDIGANYNSSITEIRYLRVTNIACVLGVIYNAYCHKFYFKIFLVDPFVVFRYNDFVES